MSPRPSAPAPRLLTTVRLGWALLAAGGPRRRWSMALVTSGVALAVLGALLCGAAATVVEARADRTAARGFSYADDSAAADGWATVRRLPFEDRMLLRVDVDAGPGLPLPPGLERWPEQGELLASPAAASFLRTDESFRGYAVGRLGGTVGPAGLRSPDELVVYRGTPRDGQPRGGVPVAAPGAGARDVDTADIPGSQVAALVMLLVALVGIPVVAFLGVAARLSAGTRARRLGALHLLGAPPSLIRRVNGIEIVGLSVVGWVVGVLLFGPANRALAASGVLGTRWFPQDTALRPVGATVLLVLVLVFALVVSGRTDIGEGMARVTVRRPEPGSRLGAWRTVPLLLGLVSLVVQVVMGAGRPAGAVVTLRLDLAMSAAILVTAIGLALAMPVLVGSAGRWLGAHGRSLAVRLGGARAAFDPSSAARTVTALVLLIMAVGVTIGQTRDARAVSVPVTSVVPITVDASEIPVGAAAEIEVAAGVPLAVVVTTDPIEQRRVVALVAPCRTLVELVGRGLARAAPQDCVDGTTYLSESAVGRGITAADLDALVPSDTGAHGSAALAQRVAEGFVEGGVDAVVTTEAVPLVDAVPEGPVTDEDGAVVHGSRVMIVLAASPSTVTSVLGGLLQVAPFSQPSAFGLDPDSGAHIAMINGFIRLGLLLGAAMTLVALGAALADRATQRRRADMELLVAGTPGAVLRAAHRWEALVTLGVGAALALVCGVLGGLAWQYAGGLVQEPDWASITGLVVGTLVACGLTVAAVVATVPRQLDLDALRRE